MPLTHVFGFIRNLLTSLFTGSVIYFCADKRTMFKEIKEVKPTVLIVVPALAEIFLNLTKQFTLGFLGGKLHTIRPIASKYNVYTQNSREVSMLTTKNLGYVTQVEVGALLVGKIKNNGKFNFKKNDEKGYFEFGGSTIVVFLEKEIQFDEDILKAKSEKMEIQVTAGEKIGTIIQK